MTKTNHQATDSGTVSAMRPMGEVTIGTINWIGLYTLYEKETRRFFKVWTQTLAAPAVTTVLFMLIFSLALGGDGRTIHGMAYSTFLAPGLMVMAMLQNSFANSSSSLVIGKVGGNIVDVLMPPLSAGELVAGFVAGGVTRGLMVGMSVGLTFVLMPNVSISIEHLWAVIYFGLTATVMLSLMGVLTGIIAEKFDHTSAVTNFIIAPLSLLSGTFYSIERLSGSWQTFSKMNPFFYMIDGFRYGFIGSADSDLSVGIIYTLAINIILWAVIYQAFRKGYRLKS